jgi:Tripartite ATP-independent periplasmic transporter, DctM component
VLAMNLQTSFLTPPFGFALFYLRSVAAKSDYKDRITGEVIPAVTTAQIYKGSIAFICLQVIMVAAVIAYPGMVTSGIGNTVSIDADKALESMGVPQREERGVPSMDSGSGGASAPAAGEAKPSATENDNDPMKALLDSVKKDAAGDKKP